MLEDLLTPQQVHENYGFTPQTLAQWRWLGRGPNYIKQTPGKGGRIKYRRAAIEQWLEQQTVSPGSAA